MKDPSLGHPWSAYGKIHFLLHRSQRRKRRRLQLALVLRQSLVLWVQGQLLPCHHLCSLLLIGRLHLARPRC